MKSLKATAAILSLATLATAALAFVTAAAAEQQRGAPVPASSRGWEGDTAQYCGLRNHWNDPHESAMSLDVGDDGIGLSLISDAFVGWSNVEMHPIALGFGGSAERHPVEALATTGPDYAIIGIPFDTAVEKGLARDSSLQVYKGDRLIVSLDTAGTSAAIAAMKACAPPPRDPNARGPDEE